MCVIIPLCKQANTVNNWGITMKKFLGIALILSLALFAGCAKKPEIKNVETVDEMTYDVVISSQVIDSLTNENEILVDARDTRRRKKRRAYKRRYFILC